MHPEDLDRLVISEFSALTLIENENDKALDSIQFCRVRNKYDEVITLAPQSKIDWYTSFRRTLIQHENALEKKGAAPKNAFVRRLEKFPEVRK